MSRLKLRPALRHWALAALQQTLIPAADLDPDAATLIAAMSVPPDPARQLLISDTIVALKTAGIWAELDEIWFFAAHDAQAGLLGWKRYKDCTAVNSPVFEADRGYAGNGTDSYIDTNYNPTADGSNFTLNDASFGVWGMSNAGRGSNVDIGAQLADSNDGCILFTKNAVGAAAYAINEDSRESGVSHGQPSTGLWVVRRSGSGEAQLYHNGIEVDSQTNASTAMPNVTFYVGASNNNGTPANVSVRQYGMAFVASSLTAQQQEDLYDIVATYMDGMSAAALSWWRIEDIAPFMVLGAYQAKGAASLAASYENLQHSGVRDLTVVTNAPSWAAGTGWTFNGTDQMLNSNTNPDANITSIVRFAGAAVDAFVIGYIHTGSRRHWIIPNGSSGISWGNGGTPTIQAPAIASGVCALAGTRAFRNGVDEGISFGLWSGAAAAGIRIGGQVNENGGALTYGASTVMAVAFFNGVLSADQIAALTTAMGAL